MALYLLLCVASGLIGLVSPLIIGLVITAVSQGALSLREPFGLCCAAVVAQLACALLAYASELLNLDLQAHAGYLLNKRTVEHVERLPESFFYGFDSALYSQRINHDSNDLVIFVMDALVQTVANALTIISVLAVLLAIDVKISLVCLLLGVSAACFYCLSRRVLFESGKEVQDRSSSFFARLLEWVDAIPFIRRHSAHGWFSSRLDSSFRDLYEALFVNQKASARFTAQNAAVEAIAYGCILLLAVSEISDGNMGVGYLATALGYYSSLSGAILYFMKWGKSYQDARVCYARLCEIWELEEEPNGALGISDIRRVSVQDLRITLADADRRLEYGSLDFARDRGVYAIVGPNGSGKTTLVNALLGLCQGAYGGHIKINDVDLARVDRRALRACGIGCVEQDPLIVCGSLWDNLTLFAEGCDASEVAYYVEQLGLQALLEDLPNGMDTVLDGHGRSISGGERQKIAIVRLLLKDPKAMFFDEPTSALDEASREALIEILRSKKRDHLIVVVSHDQKLVDACDEVIRI